MAVYTPTLKIPVRGMTCASCSTRLERVLARVDGVEQATVDLTLERATVTALPNAFLEGRVVEAIRGAGFEVPPASVRLRLGGMTCASCATRIEKVLRRAAGVVSANVNLASEIAAVAYTPGLTEPSRLIRVVEDAGYTAVVAPTDEEDRAAQEAIEAARQRRELAVLLGAVALTLPLVAPMLAAPFLGRMPMLPGWLQLLLAAPVQVVAGARFYRGALGALRAFSANMDVLVALGTSAAFGLSAVLLALGHHHLYFESSASVITLVLLGKTLEARARRSTTAAIRALVRLQPRTARVVRGEGELEVPVETVGVGETVVIRPGERVPVDGTVTQGESELDTSMLTGESAPVPCKPGDAVVGGVVNGSGLLRVEVGAVGE
ncbi:MAG: cation transporter, partial [Myxococcales bacterium]|nr:cation transporter [Myxococcales bacterium]